MRERRRYVRSDGLILVEYKGEKVEGKSSAFDVSGAGVRLTLDKELKIGFQVELEMYLPGDSQPLRASGEVVWVKKCKAKPPTQITPQKEYFYTGIKFTLIDEPSRSRVTNYVSKKFRTPT